jgi:predicted DNA-binding antitoxin AbrB/MazE fold protein
LTKTIKARYRRGIIEPLEKLDIKEGQELIVIISENLEEINNKDALDVTFGGWTDLVDAEELKKNIYADRQISTRPEVKL